MYDCKMEITIMIFSKVVYKKKAVLNYSRILILGTYY